MPTTPAARARTSQIQSAPARWKAWYPPSATRAWFMPGVLSLLALLRALARARSRRHPAGRHRPEPVRQVDGASGLRRLPEAVGTIATRGRATRARTRARQSAAGGRAVPVGPGDQLVVGVQDGQAAAPRPDHPLGHQAGPGLDARDLRPALEDEQQPAGAVGEHALEVGRAGPGLDPDRLDPTGDPDPLAAAGVADRRVSWPDGERPVDGDAGPGRSVPGRAPSPVASAGGAAAGARGSSPGRPSSGGAVSPPPGRPPAPVVRCPPAGGRGVGALGPRWPRGFDHLAVPPAPLGPPAADVERDDGRAHVRHLADHGGDLVGRAVVQEALPAEARTPGGAGAPCTRCRRRPPRRPPARSRPAPRRRSGHSMMSSGRRERPSRLHSSWSSLGTSVVDVEVDGTQVVGGEASGRTGSPGPPPCRGGRRARPRRGGGGSAPRWPGPRPPRAAPPPPRTRGAAGTGAQ